MDNNRNIIQNRIFVILNYINNDSLAKSIKQNIGLFSLKELSQLLDFLETGSKDKIYLFIKEILSEYMGLVQENNSIKNISKKEGVKTNERIEKEEELLEIEKLINF